MCILFCLPKQNGLDYRYMYYATVQYNLNLTSNFNDKKRVIDKDDFVGAVKNPHQPSVDT